MSSRQAKVARVIPIDTPDNSSSDSENDGSEDEEGKEIQVEFEARAPGEEDFHGIRRLLQQLFLRNTVVNISKIAEAILGQKYLGSVIKQSVGGDADSDDGLDDPNEVYAVSTVLSLSERQKESIAGIRTFLLEQTAKGGDRQVLQYVTDLLNKNVGFLVNERFINIPAQITVPLWETLVTEMKKARDRNLPFEFGHYIMICKLYKTKTESPTSQQAMVFSNPEEELIVAESELCIDYEVAGDADSETGGNWTDGVDMAPWRRWGSFHTVH
jgi:protein BCP1